MKVIGVRRRANPAMDRVRKGGRLVSSAARRRLERMAIRKALGSDSIKISQLGRMHGSKRVWEFFHHVWREFPEARADSSFLLKKVKEILDY